MLGNPIINKNSDEGEQMNMPHLLVQDIDLNKLHIAASTNIVQDTNIVREPKIYETKIHEPNIDTKTNIRSEFNKETKEYYLYDKTTYIGSFTISDIINYILHIKDNLIENSNEILIKTYLFKYDKINDYIKFNIVNTYPITCNYNNMINLCRELIDYESKSTIIIKEINQSFIVKRFIINILEYTIKMIGIIFDTQELKQDIKMKLYYHSVILQNYAIKYISNKFSEQEDTFVLLNKAISNINSIQSTIDTKQNKINVLLNEQNNLLSSALEKCIKYDNKILNLDDNKVPENKSVNSIRNLTEKMQELELLNNENINDDIKKSEDNNFNENYNDSDSSSPMNIQKIESSNYSGIINI